MKILFFPFYAVTPHLETDFELIYQHMIQKDDVYVIVCKRNLPICYNNMNHLKSRCIICQSKILQTLKRIDFPSDHIISLSSIKDLKIDFPTKFSNVSEIIDYQYVDMNLGLGIASNLIDYLNMDHEFDTIKHSKLVEKESITVHYVFKEICKILTDLKPKRIVFFNGRFSEARTIYFASKKTKTMFFTHERGGRKGDYLLRDNTFPHDIYIVQDEIEQIWSKADPNTREESSHNWFKERRSGIEQSWFSYVHDQKQGLLPPEYDPKKKNIIIFNSTMAERYTIPEFELNLIYQNELDGIKKILTDFEDREGFFFFIRVHPHLKGSSGSQSRFYKQLGQEFDNVCIIPPESEISSYTLLDHADVIITFGSTVAVEACYWKKPVINACNTVYQKLNIAYQPSTHQELIELILSDLEPLDSYNTLKYAYWSENFGVNFKHFEQTGLYQGTFLGKMIKPSKLAYLRAGFYRLFEIRSFKELIENVSRQIRKI